MEKLYDRIIWENDTTPALNDDNLNAMSKGIDDIDDRVITLGSAVLEVVPELEEILSHAEDLVTYRNQAQAAAESADDSAEDSEAWAVGTRGGEDVPSTDPAYHNNAKYWAQQSSPSLWANIQNKPFSTIGSGLTVTSDALNADVQSVSLSRTGTASASDASYQKIQVNGSAVGGVVAGSMYLESTTKTTSGGQDCFTFTNSNITSTAALTPYTDKFNVSPSNIEVTGTTANIYFSSSDSVTKCRLYID